MISKSFSVFFMFFNLGFTLGFTLEELKNNHLKIRWLFKNLVDPQGFEPRQTVPKTGVLPLHHGSALNCECKYS